MRGFLPMLLVAGVLLFPCLADAQNPHCKAREAALERKLSQAEAAGNNREAAGIEQALDQVRRFCTDKGLLAEAEKKLDSARRETAEREKDLREARAKGDRDKIAKRERKLEEARQEMREAERERDMLAKPASSDKM